MNQHGWIWLRSVATVALLAALCPTAEVRADDAPAGGTAADQPAADVPDRMATLIAQLGDADYFVRERAQAELAAMGFEAFDALSEAEESDDIEIASRVKYLLRKMRIEWSSDSDPAKVREILADYERQDAEGRLERMRLLAALPDDAGLPALCRLLRFEQSQVLSKLAAVAIMEQATGERTDWARRDKRINEGLRRSPRPGAEWLRVYLAARNDPSQALAQWVELTQAENDLLTQYPDQTRTDLVTALIRQQVELLDGLSRFDEALPLVQQMVTLTASDPEASNTAAVYAYKLADRHDQAGRGELAGQLADLAASVNPGNALKHLQLAFLQLQREEGLYKWAEREYRQVIEIGGPGRDLSLNAQSFLAEMLHDIERERDAAEALEAMAAAMQENIKQGNADQNGSSELGTVRARMNYFHACAHAQQGERDKQIERLEAGIKEDPLDADVLIALYRLPDRTPQQKERTLQLIRDAAAEFRQQIQFDPDSPDNHAPYNQLAWLLANTERDQSEALAASLKSLELRPKAAGYMDTLAHCHYALGDYKNSVKVQTEAVELEPHSLQMQRMLVVFRDALDKQQQDKQRKQ